jgi:anaerobic ribonucleoside-triphosphate reductase activating protein
MEPLAMRYHEIVAQSYVDGPGLRTVLFVQGCPIECPGCQNPHLWPEADGQERSAADLVRELLTVASAAQGYPRTGPAITITGGEPFAQAKSLAYLVSVLNAYGAHIIVYTGFVWEDLWAMSEGLPEIRHALERIDVLVDGPYIRAMDNDWMQYRGSSNQRVIDVPATLRTWHDRPFRIPPEGESDCGVVTLDWDVPEVITTPEGNILGASAVTGMLEAVGPAKLTRRCGNVAPRQTAKA